MPTLPRLLAAAILLHMALPTGARAEGEKIVDIVVKGNKRIESPVILNAIKLKAGDSLYTDKTDADLRAIYKLGHFLDVQVSTEETTKGTVLIYTVLEKPIIRDIRFEGNKEISTEKLTKDGLELHRDTIFSAKDLNRSVAKIKKMYEDDGYYLAEVTPGGAETLRDGTGRHFPDHRGQKDPDQFHPLRRQ